MTTTTKESTTNIYKLLHGKHKQKIGTHKDNQKPIYRVWDAMDKNNNLVESSVDLAQKFKNKFAYADAIIVGAHAGVVTIEAAEQAKQIAIADEKQKNKILQDEIDRLNAKMNGSDKAENTDAPDPAAAATTTDAANETDKTSDDGNADTTAPNIPQGIFDSLDLSTFQGPFSLETIGRGQWNIDDSEGKQVLTEAVTKVVADKILVLIKQKSKA